MSAPRLRAGQRVRRGLVSPATFAGVALLLAGCTQAEAHRAQPSARSVAPGPRTHEGGARTNASGAKPLAGKVVLLAGDSMVGGDYGGLQKSLRSLFEDDGARYERDIWEAVSIVTFDAQDRFDKLLAAKKPDIVLLTLGANDVRSYIPDSFVPRVRSIVKKIGARECWWITPATWKGDTGIVRVIRENAAPCRVFDSSGLDLPRIDDGIHPTPAGGEAWALAFWELYREERAKPARP
jgi:lysophospholipase L1-like esterase